MSSTSTHASETAGAKPARVRQPDAELDAAFATRDAERLMARYRNSPDLFTVGEGGAITAGYTNFRRHLDSEWRIVFEHISANAPAPQGAAGA
jgi:ketosteroid isomerase-like protein